MRSLALSVVLLLAVPAAAGAQQATAEVGTPVAGQPGEFLGTLTLPAEAIPPGALTSLA